MKKIIFFVMKILTCESSAKKLLVVSPYYCDHGGGVEIVAGQLVGGLARKGWSIVWVASAGSHAANAIWKMQAVEANNSIEEKTGVPFLGGAGRRLKNYGKKRGLQMF